MVNINVITRDVRVTDLKYLWSLCFPGEEAYKDFFFTRIRDKNTSLLAEVNGKSVGMLHMLPQTFVSPNGKHLPARYLYAIGAHPEYRGLGVARTLIERALESMWRRGDAVATLVPGNSGLFRYYTRLGFEPCFIRPPADAPERVPRHQAVYRDIPQLQRIYDNAMKDRVHILRNEARWQLFLDECRVTGGKILFSDLELAVLDYKGRVREFLPAPMPGNGQPYGCARIVDTGKVRRWAGIDAKLGDSELTSRVFADAYMNLMFD